MADLRDVIGLSDNERVYRHVRREIIEGRYQPGERIIEARVADTLAVSRTPVREAVRRLETEGLVVTEHNRGAQVRTITEADVADLYEARARLEGFMSELAARRAEPEDVAAIGAAADRFDQVANQVADRVAADGNAADGNAADGNAADGNAADGSAGDRVEPDRVEGLRALLRANDRFHNALVSAGRADQVHRILATAVDLPLVFGAFELYSPDEIRRSALFHRLIAEAVAARQPDRAGRLMTEHVLQGRDAHLLRFHHARQETESA